MSFVRPLVLSAIVCAGIYAMSVGVAGQDAPAGRGGIDPRDLATSVGDGFTIASVGDVILAFPESQNPDPEFQAVLKIIKDADVVTGNYEGRGSSGPEAARRILTRLQKLSAPLGTTIAIEGNQGVIRQGAASTAQRQ